MRVFQASSCPAAVDESFGHPDGKHLSEMTQLPVSHVKALTHWTAGFQHQAWAVLLDRST